MGEGGERSREGVREEGKGEGRPEWVRGVRDQGKG